MRLETAMPVQRIPVLAERQLIENVWKFERKSLFPRPVRETVPVQPENDSGQDFAAFFIEDGFGSEMNIDAIEQMYVDSRLSNRQLAAIILIFMIISCGIVGIVTFVDIHSVSNDVIKRLY